MAGSFSWAFTQAAMKAGNGAAEVANSLGSDPGASRRISLEPGVGVVRVDPS